MNKKWKTAAVVFLCLIAVSSVSFSAVTLARVRKLEDNLSAVQHSVTSIDSDINSTLNSAITTITQTAEKSASIVSDYKVIWGECSQQNQTMEMTVRIMPKEFDDLPRCGCAAPAIRPKIRATTWCSIPRALRSAAWTPSGWSPACTRRR